MQFGTAYRVTKNGEPLYSHNADGRARHYFVAAHFGDKPINFLEHGNIHNHLLTLGSWYGTGGYALCYQRVRNAPILLRPRPPLLPTTTALLSNYPNPFNPETWIPYQLAKPSDVKITIYDTRGVVVRHLDLGHQPAGTYTHRTRAAHWDGRDASGKRVASGIYFYQLQTDELSTTRKMVILK